MVAEQKTLVAENRIEERVKKRYAVFPIQEIASAPLDALEGISEEQAREFGRLFGIHTIEELANGNVFIHAWYIQHWADLPSLFPDIDLSNIVQPEYLGLTPLDLLEKPIMALQGMNEPQADFLRHNFHVHSIEDLSYMLHFNWARDIIEHKYLSAQWEETNPPARGIIQPGHFLKNSKPKSFLFSLTVLVSVGLVVLANFKTIQDFWQENSKGIEKGTEKNSQNLSLVESAKQNENIQPKPLNIENNTKDVSQEKSLALEKDKKQLFNEPRFNGKNNSLSSSNDLKKELRQDLKTVPMNNENNRKVRANLAGGEKTSIQFPQKKKVVKNQIYIVKNGDTLALISYRFYRRYDQWNKIFSANRNKLKNPVDIYPGLQLTIP